MIAAISVHLMMFSVLLALGVTYLVALIEVAEGFFPYTRGLVGLLFGVATFMTGLAWQLNW